MELQLDFALRIEVHTHFFKVTRFNAKIHALILKFCTKYVHYKLTQQNNKEAGKVYASRTKDDKEFRFHIGQLPDFLEHLEFNFIFNEHIEFVKEDVYVPKTINLKLKPKWVLRDIQIPAVDFCVQSNDEEDLHSRMVTAPTGSGKSLMSIAAACHLKHRTMVVVLPKYQEKWCSDLVHYADITAKDVMNVQGSDQLKGLIQLAKNNGKVCPFTVVSLTTIQNFFKAYEENRFSEEFLDYGCEPHELCRLLDIGTVIVDEAHEHLYSVFKLMLYSHVPKFIALSGTMLSDDNFIANMQHVMFPKEIRFDDIKKEKFIKVYPISYVFKDFKNAKIRTNEHGSKHYSHIAFEKSIMRRKDLLDNYIKLIESVIGFGFFSTYVKGDKLLIYAASVAMCTILTNHFKEKYKHMDVRRYVENDPYENVIDADIRVSTIFSAGTALDIPGLRVVIMTNSLNSTVSNTQALGRLRKLPDRDVRFYYLYCEQIKKQVDYHRNKMEIFEHQTATIKEFRANVTV